METLCRLLIELALRKQTSDIHLIQNGNRLRIEFRTPFGLEVLDQDLFHADFLEYLKFRAGMDLCSPYTPQSREFSQKLNDGSMVECRFSMMTTDSLSTGVLRLLHSSHSFPLHKLTSSKEAISRLLRFTQIEHGLVISCGPTGSGKSTAIHALLNEILSQSSRKIVTLEDPIEIHEPDMVQIQVSEARGITYERGIEELMRHDPDILFFGECRSAYAARMTLRGSLTGHFVLTTLHCASGAECIGRLKDLGLPMEELRMVLKGIFVCRLIHHRNHREAVYEIWNEEDIKNLFEHPLEAVPGISFETCLAQIQQTDQ